MQPASVVSEIHTGGGQIPGSLPLWALLSASLPSVRSHISHPALCFGQGGGVALERGMGVLGTAEVADRTHIIKSRGLHCVLPTEIPRLSRPSAPGAKMPCKITSQK